MFQVLVGMGSVQPSEFWQTSWHECTCAVEGFMEFNSSNKEEPMSRDELAELMELYPY